MEASARGLWDSLGRPEGEDVQHLMLLWKAPEAAAVVGSFLISTWQWSVCHHWHVP